MEAAEHDKMQQVSSGNRRRLRTLQEEVTKGGSEEERLADLGAAYSIYLFSLGSLVTIFRPRKLDCAWS